MAKKKIIFNYILFFIFINFIIFSDEKDYILNKAIEYEKNNDIPNALKLYNKYLESNKNDVIFLKTIRLSDDFEKSILKYKQFFKEYPESKFNNLARYELANLYLLILENDNALNEFISLKEKSHGTEYYVKSSLNIALINYGFEKFDIALKEISECLKISDDYDFSANCYYLLALTKYKLNSVKESEKNFIYCIKNYPDSLFAASSLLELFKINIELNRFEIALKYAYILKKKYYSTFQYNNLLILIKKNNLIIPDFIDIKDFNVNENDENLKNSFNKNDNKILKDLELSINNIYFNDIVSDEAKKNIYIQLAYLLSEENALIMLEKYKKDGITDIFVTKTNSSNSDKIGYRILIGPFNTREEASKKIELLKKNNVSSIIMELVKKYE